MTKKKLRSPYKLVYPVGRNTPIVVTAKNRSEAIAKARKKKAAGSKSKIAGVKTATQEQAVMIRKGRWIRARLKGGSSKSGSFKYRPHLKKKAKGRKVK
ncbi:MAG: hypothetical protein HC878_00255 [Leptolyngbyaceae cyanobacterium SL_5_14]|nr:hypothetical protein [Leptolyngbyaceae cyanobacterium SL_5_14]